MDPDACKQKPEWRKVAGEKGREMCCDANEPISVEASAKLQ